MLPSREFFQDRRCGKEVPALDRGLSMVSLASRGGASWIPSSCRHAMARRCASAPRGGRSRGLAIRPSRRRGRSEWPVSWWTGRTTTSGQPWWTMPAWAKAGASLLWTPPTERSPSRSGPMSAVGWRKTPTAPGRVGTNGPPFRHWLNAHLHTVQKRVRPFRNEATTQRL